MLKKSPFVYITTIWSKKESILFFKTYLETTEWYWIFKPLFPIEKFCVGTGLLYYFMASVITDLTHRFHQWFNYGTTEDIINFSLDPQLIQNKKLIIISFPFCVLFVKNTISFIIHNKLFCILCKKLYQQSRWFRKNITLLMWVIR